MELALAMLFCILSSGKHTHSFKNILSYQNAMQKYDIQVEKVRFEKKQESQKLEMSRFLGKL